MTNLPDASDLERLIEEGDRLRRMDENAALVEFVDKKMHRIFHHAMSAKNEIGELMDVIVWDKPMPSQGGKNDESANPDRV
jgi:hypothetical protein